MKKFKLFFLIGVVTFFLSSCAGIVEKPKISIDKITLGEISLQKSSAVFTLRVHNPNAFPIFLSGINYGLKLNGTEVANGENTNRIAISAGSEQTVQMPIQLKPGTLMKLVPAFWRDKQFKYELTGTVKTPIINLPFNRVGGIGVSD